MNHVKDILQSRTGNRKYHRASMGSLPTQKELMGASTEGEKLRHYPIRRLDQNQIMFNEIFVKPKQDQLAFLAHQREEEFKQFKQPLMTGKRGFTFNLCFLAFLNLTLLDVNHFSHRHPQPFPNVQD